MKWQSILEGKKTNSIEIKDEISNLTNSGQKMESELVDLESSLQGLQKDLLAGVPNGLEAVRTTEARISEHRNKRAGISSVIEELENKLKEVLVDEKNDRLTEIIAETKKIDAQIAEIRLEILEYYANAAALYVNITGSPYHYIDNFFENYNLSRDLRQRIDELSTGQGISLHRRRKALSNESVRLRKKG